MTRPAALDPRHGLPTVLVAAALAAGAAGAALLPWWRAEQGAVLLSSDAVLELPPDSWTGAEVLGPWVAVVAMPASAAVVLALLATTGRGRPWVGPVAVAARWAAAVAGLAAVVGAVRVLVQWGPSAAPGPWLALIAGLAATGTAVALPGPRRGARPGTGAVVPHAGGRLAASAAVGVLLVVALVVVPGGPTPPPRAAVGPFVPVAAVGMFALRSGEPGLAATDDARPVLVGGVPGVVSRAGVVVATADGRARVLARPGRGAPAPIGVVGDRVVRWISGDAVAVTELRAGAPLDVEVRGVTEAGALGSDGSVWLRSDADPAGTVRRLDVARLEGRQRIAATYLPVVTIQEPVPPVDLRTVLPVRGGGLRALADAGRLELLTDTAAGIATRPLAGTRCGAAGAARLDRAAADRSGVWFVLVGADGERLAHLDPTSSGAVRTVSTVLPGTVTALAAPGDGSLLVVARDARGATLWRLPDAVAALGAPPVSCPPA